MNKIVLLITTLILVGIEIILSFYIKIGFVLMLFVFLMGLFIIFKKNVFALSTAVSIFIFGGILAFMQNHFYVSNDILISKNIVIDKKTNKKYKILNSSKIPSNGYLTCYYSTLFGKELKDKGCYYVVNDKLFKVEKINR